MTRFILITLTLIFFSGLLTMEAAAQSGLNVNSLRIGTHPEKTRMVVELSQAAHFRAFYLSSPPRIVIDLPSFNWKAGTPPAPPGSFVRAVRYGPLQPGISRIVVETEQAVSLKDVFSMPAAGSNPNRVVIDFTKAGASFNPAQQRSFGSLNNDNLSQPPKQPAKQEHVLRLPSETPSPKPQVVPAAAPVGPIPGLRDIKPQIVIDPGHGGQDPGALGAGGRKEKDITLAVAKDLKKALEDTGRYEVHLTRTTDTFIKLQDRVKIARRHGADLFISLHADSIDKAGVRGASIYTLSNKASDEQTAKLAARENRADLIAGVDLSREDKEVADILIDLAMRDTMNQSKFFANTVVNTIDAGRIDLLEKPHRFAGFAVLKAPDIPSVLIEMGFMSNNKEVAQLSDPTYRKKLAKAITAGVDGYFTKVRKKTSN